MALQMAGLWAALACILLLPEAGVHCDPLKQSSSAMEHLARPTPNSGGQPRRKSGSVAGRINQGHFAVTGQFPYMAFLEIYHLSRTCSGFLIDPDWVMTAAHCITNSTEVFGSSTQVFVTLGRTNADNKNETWEQYVPADKLVTHPRYSFAPNYHNDIGLVHLSEPADFAGNTILVYIDTIRLSQQHSQRVVLINGTISGYGQYDNTPGFPTRHLKYANVRLVARAFCRLHYPYRMNDDGALCIEDIDGDPCPGDSGSPFVHNNTVLGMYVYGNDACNGDLPHVLTDVGKYYKWIQKTIIKQAGTSTARP